MAELSLSQLIQESLSTPIEEPEIPRGKSLREDWTSRATGVSQADDEAIDKAHKGDDYDRDAEFIKANNSKRKRDWGLTWRNSKDWMKKNPGKTAAIAGGGLAAAGGLAAYLHHRSKNKGIINKMKNNPGKTAAGASLAALGAGAGVAALIRHLRKKKNNK